jgi:hypothetical protein
MIADKKPFRNICNPVCTAKKNAEEDFSLLQATTAEISALLNQFSNAQDIEVYQISDFSETSFKNSPKL